MWASNYLQKSYQKLSQVNLTLKSRKKGDKLLKYLVIYSSSNI